MSRLIIIVSCIALVGVVALLAGCPEDPYSEEVHMPPPDDPADQAMDPALVPTDFEWTDTPSLEEIPSGPIVGMLNGEPFEAQLVRVRKSDEDTFQLEILNKAREDGDPTGMVTGEDGWQLRFTWTEGESGSQEWAIADDKDFNSEHVYYWYAQGEDQGPMSVNYPWGAALEISEWTLTEDEENDRILGNVTGKVALVMNDDESSFAAGEFDAVYYQW